MNSIQNDDELANTVKPPKVVRAEKGKKRKRKRDRGDDSHGQKMGRNSNQNNDSQSSASASAISRKSFVSVKQASRQGQSSQDASKNSGLEIQVEDDPTKFNVISESMELEDNKLDDSDMPQQSQTLQDKLEEVKMRPLLIGETQTREPVNIPKLHIITAKISDQDQQERNYNNQEPFEVARKNHARKRKPLKPSKNALEAKFSDNEDEKDLGEELLGIERAADIRNFCQSIRKFFTCKSEACLRFCRKSKQTIRARQLKNELSDDENPSNPIFSPTDPDDRDRELREKDEKHHEDKKKDEAAAKAHKKNKKRRKRDEEIIKGQTGEQEDDESQLICKLCMREQPLYFYQQEDIIKRLPERSLTKLLTQMKQDLQAKLSYLKYLKVSAKFCQPCECWRKKVHIYCQTAHIIRNQRIYCEKCGGQYNLFIKEERVCSSKFISLLVKYFLFTLLLIIVTSAFLVLDGYLKMRHAQENPEIAEDAKKNLEAQQQNNWLSFGYIPNFMTDSFDPFKTVSWTHLTHLAMIEVILIGKCVYSQLARAVQTRKKIIYIEVRNQSDRMPRHLSKRNLNTVVETFQKKKNYALFDKFWYLKRAEAFVELDYQGLCVDDWNNVSHSLQSSQLLQKGLTMPRGSAMSANANKRGTLQSMPSDSTLNQRGGIDALLDDQEPNPSLGFSLNLPKAKEIEMSVIIKSKGSGSQNLSKATFQPDTLESPTLGGKAASFMANIPAPVKQETVSSNNTGLATFALNYTMKTTEHQKESPRMRGAETKDLDETPTSAPDKETSNKTPVNQIVEEDPQEPLILNKGPNFDRRRVASMVEHVHGGDPNKILEIVAKYRQGKKQPGQLSDGIMSMGESVQYSNQEGASKNLLKTFKNSND